MISSEVPENSLLILAMVCYVRILDAHNKCGESEGGEREISVELGPEWADNDLNLLTYRIKDDVRFYMSEFSGVTIGKFYRNLQYGTKYLGAPEDLIKERSEAPHAKWWCHETLRRGAKVPCIFSIY